MKKIFIILTLILVSLAVLLPFASSNPDALEKVTSNYNVQEQTPVWQGIMPDYSVAIFGDSYVSTLIAGSVGTLIVLAAALLIGKSMTKQNAAAKIQ
jgi:ABC-type Fe3+ transport system permease subunit